MHSDVSFATRETTGDKHIGDQTRSSKTMSTINQEARWYVLGDGVQNYGPYTVEELQQHFASGYLSESSLVWAEGRAEWSPLSAINELKALLIAQTPLSHNVLAAPCIISKEARTGAGNVVQESPKDMPGARNEDDDFARWQEEVKKAEEEHTVLKSGKGKSGGRNLFSIDRGNIGSNSGDAEEGPPDGELEFTDDDGTVYHWDYGRKAWVPQGESLKEVPAYRAEEMVFDVDEEVFPTMKETLEGKVDETVSVEKEIPEPTSEKKRKIPDSKGPAKPPSENMPDGWFELKVNTHVYVTGLPDDVTFDEVAEVFTKCGIIKEDPDTKKLRIKLYTDKTSGCLKGDALVTYLKEPSVELAIKLLDGAPFRPGDKQLMTVTRAKFEQKGEVFIKKEQNKQKKKKLKNAEQKALGWGGFDDVKRKQPMGVLLKNMFTQEELVSDPTLLTDLEADVAEECGKIGLVERLRVYKNSTQGVILVKFKDRESGLKCISIMNGRWFGGKKVEAVEDDGRVNYALTDAVEEAVRLEKFGEELEAD